MSKNIFINLFFRRINFAIILIILFALLFRLTNLTSKIIWHDEIHSQLHIVGYYSQELKAHFFNGSIIHPQDLFSSLKLKNNLQDSTFVDTIKGLLIDDPHHPPLYYLLARFWLHIWGDNIISARVLSIISGVLILPIAYFLSQQIFNNQKINLIFTLLIANSPFFILFSQEAREYSLWTLFILTSYLYLLKALKTTSIKLACLYWGIYTLSIIAGIYTSALMLIVIFSQWIYLVILNQWNRRNLFCYFLSLSLSFFAFLPWLIGFLNNFQTYKIATAWISETQLPLNIYFQYLFINLGRLFLLLNEVTSLNYHLNIYIVSIIIILLINSLIYIVLNCQKNIKIFLLCFSLTPILMLIIPDLLLGGIRGTISRYLVPSQLGLLLIISYFLGINYKYKIAKILLAFLLILGLSANIKNMYATTAWTKDINYNLTAVANIVNNDTPSLIIGNDFGYHFGTFFALSYLLNENVNLQLFSHQRELQNFQYPADFNKVYFLNMPDSLKLELKSNENIVFKESFSDRDLWLWEVKLRDEIKTEPEFDEKSIKK